MVDYLVVNKVIKKQITKEFNPIAFHLNEDKDKIVRAKELVGGSILVLEKLLKSKKIDAYILPPKAKK